LDRDDARFLPVAQALAVMPATADNRRMTANVSNNGWGFGVLVIGTTSVIGDDHPAEPEDGS
jgi:hypothetical protein